MEFRRKVGFGLSIAALGIMASLLVGPAGSQQWELEIWVAKNYVEKINGEPPVLKTYPWATLVSEFNRDFPKVKLRFKIVEREDFRRLFNSTGPTSSYPDMAFVDDWNVAGPLVSSGAVVMNGESRFHQCGWWLSLPRSKNVGTSRAFMLWLLRSPHWKPWMVGTAAMSQNDKAAVQAVSRKVVEDVALGAFHSLSADMDREAWQFALRPNPTNKVVSVDFLITFGNSRLAFVLVSWVSQGQRRFGMQNSALVLRKVGDLWKVLLYLPGALPDLEDFLMSFDRLELKNGQPDDIAQVSLVSPVDHARITRFPNNGELVWKPLNPAPAAYVVEHQFGQPGRDSWSTSWIRVVSPSHGESTIMKIPFGVGMQPHRWRVWAISGTGVVSTSDWRTVDFTN